MSRCNILPGLEMELFGQLLQPTREGASWASTSCAYISFRSMADATLKGRRMSARVESK
jgi:hypothetical protein